MTNKRKARAREISKKTGVSYQGAVNMMQPKKVVIQFEHVPDYEEWVDVPKGARYRFVAHLGLEPLFKAIDQTKVDSVKLHMPLALNEARGVIHNIQRGHTPINKTLVLWRCEGHSVLLAIFLMEDLKSDELIPPWVRSPKVTPGRDLQFMGIGPTYRVTRIEDTFWHGRDSAANPGLYPLNEVGTPSPECEYGSHAAETLKMIRNTRVK